MENFMKNVYSHSASNDYSINTLEYMVAKKTDGKLRLRRFLTVLLILLIGAPILYITFSKVPPLGAVVVILIAYFIIISMRATKLEYEYQIVQGELTMDVIIGASKRKSLTSFLIREAESIAPYTGKTPDGAKVIDACISPSDPATWCAVYKDADGNKTALLFSIQEKALELFKYYNRQATSTESIN